MARRSRRAGNRNRKRARKRARGFVICEACGKRGFRSAQTARKATKGVPNRLRVYLCRASQLWHVTNQDQGE